MPRHVSSRGDGFLEASLFLETALEPDDLPRRAGAALAWCQIWFGMMD